MSTNESHAAPRRADARGSPTALHQRRAPALPVATALIVGILADRLIDAGAPVWAALSAASLALSRVADARRARPAATFLLLAACCGLGGLRHHLRWSAVGPDDVGRHVSSEPAPVRLIGVIDSPILVQAAELSPMTPAWMRVDRSQCDIRCERLMGEDEPIRLSGRLRMYTTGHLMHAGVGDRVEVIGRLSRPRPQMNPGGFDSRAHLRSAGIRGVLNVEHPDAVSVLQSRATGRLARLRARLRDDCEQILVQHLDSRTTPLAMSLLVGERSLLPDDVYDAFAESGMMHVLAISGLHVGILATLLIVLSRALHLPIPAATLVVLVGVLGYAFVTNHRPPVIRAGVLAVTIAAGWPWFRQAGGVNLIALCAAVVLMINPADLFDVGAQLSFLSVFAISWSVAVVSGWRRNPWRGEWVDRLFDPSAGIGRSLLRWLVEGYVITAAIWFVTQPLIAARFHIVSLVGFPINVLLIPFVVVILWLGFATLFCGLLAPWIIRPVAAGFDALLHLLQSTVETAARWRVGHVSVAGPPEWWLVGFYALLAAAMVIRLRPPLRRAAWRGVGVWVIIGLVLPLMPPHREGLRCTVLSVGHGCAVVLELPGGETLLYDAGMIGSPRRGRSIVQSALWEQGVKGVDGIVISHADVDHFNAIAGLLTSIPVGTLLFHRTFLDFSQEPVAELCEAAAREQVPIRLLHEGDRLLVGEEPVELAVIHPPADWRGRQDNANSVVLRIRYAGRTLLLTGDLEREGLARLLHQPAEAVDLLLAPHHGSISANPVALSQWASPQTVVISGGNAGAEPVLRTIYHHARQVLSTRQSGAVIVQVLPDGQMSVSTWTGSRHGPPAHP